MIRPRSLGGTRLSSFSADRTTCRSQGMEELIEGHVFAPFVLHPTPAKRPELGRGGCDDREAVGEVGAKRFADKLGAGSVLGFPNPLDFLDHLRWKGDGHGLACSHLRTSGVNWCYLILPTLAQECQGVEPPLFLAGVYPKPLVDAALSVSASLF